MPSRIERPEKVTLALTVEHVQRLERLGQAMGQPVGVAATISMTLGLNALEQMYGLKDMRAALEAAIMPAAEQATQEMIAAGLPVADKSQ